MFYFTLQNLLALNALIYNNLNICRQTFNNCTFNFNGLQPDNFNGALAALLPQFMPANETIFLDDTDDSD